MRAPARPRSALVSALVAIALATGCAGSPDADAAGDGDGDGGGREPPVRLRYLFEPGAARAYRVV